MNNNINYTVFTDELKGRGFDIVDITSCILNGMIVTYEFNHILITAVIKRVREEPKDSYIVDKAVLVIIDENIINKLSHIQNRSLIERAFSIEVLDNFQILDEILQLI